MQMEDSNLIPFGGKEIRKEWHNGEWYFSVVDVIQILTDSSNPNRYWTDIKRRSEKEAGQLYAFCVSLKLLGSDGKKYSTDCANTEGVLRIVMSVPSPKAEPLRLWLAQVGNERIQETENPELSIERMVSIYRAKGHTEEWIKERMQSIETRKKLTDEWQQRGVKEGKEYSILTAIISKGTFGITPTEHKDIKGLTKQSQNLRDHMTDLELILTSLGEAVTRTIAVEEDAQGFNENREAAFKGGQIGGKARLNVEEGTGKKVVSSENFLKPSKGDDKQALPPSE
jgi:DNA-damage-inducible protein D